jgi:hypothetical protein
MTQEQYFAMCEQMGWEPRDEEIPPDMSSLPYYPQTALILFNLLSDKIEGMSGTWLGKDFSSLQTFMDIYEVDNRRDVLDYIMVIHDVYGKYYREQQKVKESSKKGRR